MRRNPRVGRSPASRPAGTGKLKEGSADPGPAAGTAVSSRRDGRAASPVYHRRGIAIALIAALVALGAASAWNWVPRPARVVVAVPALPDLRGRPAELQARLQRAQLLAADRGSRLIGVAELGRLYHASGFPVEAEACWRLLLAEQPRTARWSYYLADLRRAASDYTGMAALLARTTEVAPTYAPAWLRLADLQFKNGQFAAADHAYRRRLALLPGDPYARFGLARLALQQGRREDARQQLERLVEEAPEFPPAHNLYAELLAANGDAARATRERLLGTEKGRFRDADDPWLDELTGWCFDFERLCVLGSRDALTNHGDRGRAAFERAIQLRPDAPGAYELLGNVCLDANEPAKAREIYEEGLRRARSEQPTVRIYVNLARAYRLLQQPAEAARVCREGLARVGEEAELYLALGAALGDLGQGEAAVEAMRAAVARSPADANANYQLAVALLAVRRLDEAVEALHRSLAVQPTFPSTLALLAQIEIDSGRWQGAVRYLQPLYESHPELPEAREKMVVGYLRAGLEAQEGRDFAAAEKHYRAGLVIDGNNAELLVRLGTLCLIRGRFADAIGPLEAYHRLQPDNAPSALFLGLAYAAAGRRDEARRILARGAQLAERSGEAATAARCRKVLEQLP